MKDASSELKDAGAREEEIEPGVRHVPPTGGAEPKLALADAVEERRVRDVLHERESARVP
jgi:hypothetical protein